MSCHNFYFSGSKTNVCLVILLLTDNYQRVYLWTFVPWNILCRWKYVFSYGIHMYADTKHNQHTHYHHIQLPPTVQLQRRVSPIIRNYDFLFILSYFHLLYSKLKHTFIHKYHIFRTQSVTAQTVCKATGRRISTPYTTIYFRYYTTCFITVPTFKLYKLQQRIYYKR